MNKLSRKRQAGARARAVGASVLCDCADECFSHRPAFAEEVAALVYAEMAIVESDEEDSPVGRT